MLPLGFSEEKQPPAHLLLKGYSPIQIHLQSVSSKVLPCPWVEPMLSVLRVMQTPGWWLHIPPSFSVSSGDPQAESESLVCHTRYSSPPSPTRFLNTKNVSK